MPATVNDAVNAADTAERFAAVSAGVREVTERQKRLERLVAEGGPADQMQHTSLMIKEAAVALRKAAEALRLSDGEFRAVLGEGSLIERDRHARVCPAAAKPAPGPEARGSHLSIVRGRAS